MDKHTLYTHEVGIPNNNKKIILLTYVNQQTMKILEGVLQICAYLM